MLTLDSLGCLLTLTDELPGMDPYVKAMEKTSETVWKTVSKPSRHLSPGNKLFFSTDHAPCTQSLAQGPQELEGNVCPPHSHLHNTHFCLLLSRLLGHWGLQSW